MTSPGGLCHLVSIFIIRMKFYKNKLLTTVTAVALALAVGACSSSSDDDNGISAAQMAAEAELAALQAAFGEDDLTPDAITALSDQITALTTQVETLMARAEITPEAVQALNDRITALLAGMPEDVQALNGQIMALTTQVATLMARADITPEAVQALREQITALMATAPADIQALNDQITALNTQITTLMGRADITPADLLGLRAEITALNGQVATLMARPDTTPAAVQALRSQITDLNTQITALNTQVTNLMGRADISPADLLVLRAEVTALNGQVTTLMARADITPAAVQALRNQISSLTTQVTTLMATTPSDVRALQEVVAGFAAVRTSVTDAEGAASTAEAAVKTAVESLDKIKALGAGVAGDSARATANAQAVLDAQTDANEAVDIADAAVQSAKAALVVAKALPSDDPNRDTLIAALEDAIKAAEGYAKAAADSRGDDGDDLADAVEGMIGDDPEAEGYPKTPAQHGRAVAMDIAMALEPTDGTDGARKRGAHSSTMVPAVTFKDAVRMNDHQGSTWAEIVGTVVDKRIAVTDNGGTGTKAVKAALIEGQSGIAVHSSLTATGGTDGKYADGVQFPSSDQNGIPGTAFCGGEDCEVDEDGELTGSWYFTPTSPKEWYVEMTVVEEGEDDVTTWTPDTLYARFGHWLDDDTGTTVNTFAVVAPDGGLTVALTVNAEPETTTLTDTSATYRGPATGMSVEKTTDLDGEITEINSAAFVATVNLKATFGGSPTLGGTVTDFRGPATDPNWSVELQVKSFDGSFDDSDAGVTVASGRNGEWTAQAYGPAATMRPTGIFGGFNAHFTDGHAAGAYAAR